MLFKEVECEIKIYFFSLTQSESDQRLALRMWRKSDSIETPLVDASFGSGC